MNMKRTLLTCLTACMVFPLFAQYSGEGFYRIKNRGGAGRYISVQNDKVSEESKKLDLSSGTAQSVPIEALQLVKSREGNPGTILYVQGNATGFTLEAQGMNTQELLEKMGQRDMKLQMSSQNELFSSYQGMQVDLIDFCFDYPISKDSWCGVAGTSYIRQLYPEDKQYALWDFKKIDNENEFFGIDPNEGIEVGGKYYTTLFTSFAYQLRDGMKAYYIDQHIYDTNLVKEPIAELKEITDGKIPAATPVIIECSSDNVANNKTTLLDETLTPISENELKGRVFCFITKESDDQSMKNALQFDQNTMRVLGVVDGKLAFVANNSAALNKGYIPANKAYLPISSTFAASTANGIKLLLPSEYAVAASIKAVTSEEPAKEGIYTLTGTKVKDTNSTDNLPKGIYIINGKKQVIR